MAGILGFIITIVLPPRARFAQSRDKCVSWPAPIIMSGSGISFAAGNFFKRRSRKPGFLSANLMSWQSQGLIRFNALISPLLCESCPGLPSLIRQITGVCVDSVVTFWKCRAGNSFSIFLQRKFCSAIGACRMPSFLDRQKNTRV